MTKPGKHKLADKGTTEWELALYIDEVMDHQETPITSHDIATRIEEHYGKRIVTQRIGEYLYENKSIIITKGKHRLNHYIKITPHPF